MRRAIGVVLIGIGVFGLVLTVLLPTVVVDRSKKTPLDLNITQISSGKAQLFDATSGDVKQVDLRATRVVRTDSVHSDGKNTTVIESLCIVVVTDPKQPNCVPSSDPRLLSYTTDRVTADRKSAESVHVGGWGENVNGDTSIRHAGLSYKWPIDAKKKTYQFFQPDLGKAYPAIYKGTSKIRGLTVYIYECKTGSQPYKIQGLLDGTYDDTRTVYVEPRTGAIINGVEHQVQTLANGTVALDTTLSFEKSAIDYQSNYAKDKIDQLRMAELWGPLVCGILGAIAIVGGVLLVRSRRRADGGGGGGNGPRPDDEPRPDGAPEHGTPEDDAAEHGTPPGERYDESSASAPQA
jgi:hypothetical protein